MADVPSMWRVELLHPQFIHFTVALLITGSLCWLLSLLLDRWCVFLSRAGRFLIVLGSLFSWATIYSGTLADDEVGRTLCDPTVLERHEGNAYISAYLFSGVSVLFIAQWWTRFFTGFKKVLQGVIAAVILGGCIYLSYTAHMGAKVVYQQGGAVHHPSTDCSEFE